MSERATLNKALLFDLVRDVERLCRSVAENEEEDAIDYFIENMALNDEELVIMREAQFHHGAVDSEDPVIGVLERYEDESDHMFSVACRILRKVSDMYREAGL